MSIVFYCRSCKAYIRRNRGVNMLKQTHLHIKQRHLQESIKLFEDMFIEEKKGIPLGYF